MSCVDGQWSQPGVNYGCTAVEEVVIAGNDDPVPNTIGWTAELYGKYHGNDLSKEQRELPRFYQQRFESTLNYVNSQLLLCGGWGPQAGRTCSYLVPGKESGSWNTSYSTFVEQRADHMSVVMGGKLHLLGGDDNQEPYTTEFIEPCRSNTAKPGINLASWSRGGCAVALTHETFAVIGGLDVDSCWCGKRTAMAYNITSGEHYELPSMRYARMDHDCVMFKDQKTKEKYILVTGGRYEGSNYVGNTELLKVGDSYWTAVGQLNYPRASLKMAVMENKILALGGYVEKEYEATTLVEEYDLETKTWRMARSLLYPRAGHAVAAVPSDINNWC